MEIKRGSLVQVLPAKVGYYIVIGKTKMRPDWEGYTKYWDLAPLPSANFDHGGPMDERYIEVVNEA
tara:strand:+ start:5634 stop:5831 length:198 start_codon:yes stop_codon:yes gene_type:complete